MPRFLPLLLLLLPLSSPKHVRDVVRLDLPPLPEERGEVDPMHLFNNYTFGPARRAAVLRGAVADSGVARHWGDDAYLARRFGKHRVLVQLSRHEYEPSGLHTVMPLAKFLKTAASKDQVVKTELSGAALGELPIPHCLRCEPIMSKISRVELLLARGDKATQSHIEYSFGESLVCGYAGTLRVLVFPRGVPGETTATNVGNTHASKDMGVSLVEAHRADVRKFPRLPKARAHDVSLAAGDCVYVPRDFAFQVEGTHNPVAMLYAWDKIRRLRASSCDREAFGTFDAGGGSENPNDQVWAMMQRSRTYTFTIGEMMEGPIGQEGGAGSTPTG